jgi:hypothetical protein
VKVSSGSSIGAQPGVFSSPGYLSQRRNGQTRRPVMIERRAGTVAIASG